MGTFRLAPYALLLAACFSFADFTSSDSANLSSIHDYVNSINYYQNHIYDTLGLIYSDVTVLNTINGSINSLSADLSSIEQHTSDLTYRSLLGHSGKALMVTSPEYVEISRTELIPAINNLTNFIGRDVLANPFSYPTNYIAMQIMPYVRFDANNNINKYVSDLYKQIYGVSPSTETLQSWVNIYRRFGGNPRFCEEFLISVPSNICWDASSELFTTGLGITGNKASSAYRRYDTFYRSALASTGINVNDARGVTDELRFFASAKYAAYGTRPLYLSFLDMTNKLFHAFNVVSNEFELPTLQKVQVSSSGNRDASSFQTFLSASHLTNQFANVASSVGGLASAGIGAFTPLDTGTNTYDAYISQTVESIDYVPNTNNIHPLEWTEFSDYTDGVEHESPNQGGIFPEFWEDSKSLPLFDTISSWHDSDPNFRFEFDLPFLSSSGLASTSTTAKYISVPNVNSYTQPYMSFFVALIKAIIASFFINRIYKFVLTTVAAVQDMD